MSDAHPNPAGAGRADGDPADLAEDRLPPGPDPRADPYADPGTDRHADPRTDPRTDPYEPAGPAPLGVVRTPTGRPAVDALLDRLGDADHLTADGHLDVYEDVHRGLRAELTSLDERPAPRPYDNRS
ncbi:hypothetical protein [Streptomyces sp. NPDC050600]|uniref:hypothetical protein n=1 Tax=Streptomyces sp. NPDC050600 TaxID=3157213 RepID=UPI00343D81D5